MKTYISNIFLVFLSLIIITSCNKNEDQKEDFQKDMALFQDDIKQIGSPAQFDNWTKYIVEQKFGLPKPYSIKKIDIKNIENFQLAKISISVDEIEFSFYMSTVCVFSQKPELNKYVLKPITNIPNQEGKTLIFSSGINPAEINVSFDPENTFTIECKNGKLNFIGKM